MVVSTIDEVLVLLVTFELHFYPLLYFFLETVWHSRLAVLHEFITYRFHVDFVKALCSYQFHALSIQICFPLLGQLVSNE